MTTIARRSLLGGAAALALAAGYARAEDPVERERVDSAATAAFEKLMTENSTARELADVAHGFLIFPEITKGGFIVGMAGGKGALRVGGQTINYYETGGLSVGLKAGLQSYGYVLMFMTPASLEKFQSTQGFKLGVDASVAVYKGATTNIDTTNIKQDTIAFVFDTQGLMLDLSIEGSQYKISDI